MRSETKTIIEVLRYLSEEGISSEDGVANAAIAEAANRLEELYADNQHLENQNKVLNIKINMLLERIARTERRNKPL